MKITELVPLKEYTFILSCLFEMTVMRFRISGQADPDQELGICIAISVFDLNCFTG